MNRPQDRRPRRPLTAVALLAGGVLAAGLLTAPAGAVPTPPASAPGHAPAAGPAQSRAADSADRTNGALAGDIAADPAAAPAAQGRAPHPGPLAPLLATRTTGEDAHRHLEALQDIADRHDGNRAAGTSGYDASARYVGEQLAAAGYDVTYETLTFPYREPLAERLVWSGGGADGEDRELPIQTMTYTPDTPEGGHRARLVEVVPAEETDGGGGESGPAGAGCSAEDFAQPGSSVEGRIVLLKRGGCDFSVKQAHAADAGALAAVIYNNVPGALDGSLGAEDLGRIPTGGIAHEDGRALSEALAAGEEVTVEVEIRELGEERTTVNVLADTPGGDPGEMVMAGAHLDSTFSGPGINDNGSGVAGVLESAVRFAETARIDAPRPGHRNQVRFAFWAAEEIGKLGSAHHVAELSDAERERIALYLNFDMIASPNYGLFVYDGDGSEGLNEPGPAGSAQIERAFTDYLTRAGHPVQPTPFNGRSDYGAFIDVGIPAGGTFTGAEGVKGEDQAELWGGAAGEPYDTCYHQECDGLENVDRTALDANTRAIAHTVGRYAWSTASLRQPLPEPETASDSASADGVPADARTGSAAGAGTPGASEEPRSAEKATADDAAADDAMSRDERTGLRTSHGATGPTPGIGLPEPGARPAELS